MKRHGFLLLLGIWLCAGGCGLDSIERPVPGEPSSVDGLPEADPPNVVLISLDTFRADRLSQAPFISELAEKGWQSTRVWSSSNWTLPAHVSLLTSTPPSQHDLPRAGSRLPYSGERFSSEISTLAEAFREAGYFTAATTDGGFLAPRFGLERGFDRFVAEKAEEEGDSFARHRSAVADFLQDRRGRPFFLFVHTYEIHDYFLNTPPYHRFVDPEADREAIAHGSWLEEIKKGTAPKEYVSRLYDSGVRWTDEFVEALVGDLETLAPEEDLLVVITSDHGESFGDRPGLWHHGEGLWEEQLRVPLVGWGNYTSAPKGFSDRPVALIDIAPSLLSEVGLASPASFQGRPDVFKPLRTSDDAHSEGVLPEIEAARVHTGPNWRSSFVSQALIESGWKYFRRDSFEGKTREEVCFDLEADPDEQENRLSDPASPCADLERQLAGRLSGLPATALHLTAFSSSPITLELDEPEVAIAVRTGGGSGVPIGRADKGVFRWQPQAEGDQLMLVLRQVPARGIRVGLGPEPVLHSLTWADLATSSQPLALMSGGDRVLVRASGRTQGQAGSEVEAEIELMKQLKALGYAE